MNEFENTIERHFTYIKHSSPIELFRRTESGTYFHHAIENAWIGWQARAACKVDVEKVARAIHQCHFHPNDHGTAKWEEIYHREKRLYTTMAKAAIAAMGEGHE